MSLHAACCPQMSKMLENLDAWLERATDHAKERGYDPELLLTARLAPDQYPLRRQVQIAADAAKFAAARLAGVEPQVHADGDESLAELRARLRGVIAWVRAISGDQLVGAADRTIALPFLEGKVLSGADYFNQMAQPNFYFHVVTAYAILRHNGVPLGKRDYIGDLPVREAAS